MRLFKSIVVWLWVLIGTWVGAVLLLHLLTGMTLGRGAFAGFAFLPALLLLPAAIPFTLLYGLARLFHRP